MRHATGDTALPVGAPRLVRQGTSVMPAAVAADPSAMAARRAAEVSVDEQSRRNAEFARYFAEQQAARDAALAAATQNGRPLDGFDERGPKVRVRVRLMPSPISAEDRPTDLTLLGNPEMPVAKLFAFLRHPDLTPPGVPFRLVRNADADAVLPESATDTLGALRLDRQTLEQQLVPAEECFVCARARRARETPTATARDGDSTSEPDSLRAKRTRITQLRTDLAAIERGGAPSEYTCRECTFLNPWSNTRCSVCDTARPSLETAMFAKIEEMTALDAEVQQEEFEHTARVESARRAAERRRAAPAARDSSVRTFIVFGGCIGLCARHRCRWLEDLCDSASLTFADLAEITPDFVADSLTAKLV